MRLIIDRNFIYSRPDIGSASIQALAGRDVQEVFSHAVEVVGVVLLKVVGVVVNHVSR